MANRSPTIPGRLWSLSDPARVAIQTAAAAVAAWFAGHAIGQDAVSWAVFSAVFVVQGNIGGTIASATGRVIGAILGVLVALAAIFTIGTGEWRTLLSLAIGVGIMSLVSGWRPSYSYGLVTVTMIIVAPGFEVVENAIERSAAVIAGTVIGALASTVLFPRAARAQSRAAAGRALRGCAKLLRATTQAVVSGDTPDLLAIHKEIESAVAEAQSSSRSGQNERLLPIGQRTIDAPVLTVQRIWYSLAVLDRLSDRSMPRAVSDILAEPVRAAGDAAAGALDAAADDLARGKAPEHLDVRQRLKVLNEALDRLRDEKRLDDLPREDVERVLTLGFAFEQICRNISELAESYRKRDESDKRGKS